LQLVSPELLWPVHIRPENIDTFSPPSLRSGGPLKVGAMKSWLEQPKLIPVRERIVSALTPEQYRFRRVSPVVFLCGGFESKPRDNLRDYLRLKYPNLGIFYAERVWEVIASNPGLGALKMEFIDIVHLKLKRGRRSALNPGESKWRMLAYLA
jgi:hypothetical protein